MKRTLSLSLFLLSLFHGASPAKGESYTIGVEDVDYPPIFSLKQGVFSGYTRELLDMFAQNRSIQLSYLPFPIRRLMKEYEKGNVDCIFPDNPKWDSADKKLFKIYYSVPALTFQDAVMVPADRVGKPIKTLGIILGFQPWKFGNDIKSGRLRAVDAPGALSLLQMVLKGRIDGGNLALQVARYHLQALGKTGALLPDPKLMPLVDSHYHLSCIQFPDLIKDFDRFMQTEEKAVLALQQKYGFF